MFIEDYMTDNPKTISPESSLSQAMDILKNQHVHHLPVTDQAGRLVGIITDRDVRSAIGYDETLRMTLSVSEVMTADPETINADATLEEALTVFYRRRRGALPVVRGQCCVGIITRHDVLHALYKMLGLDEEGTRVEIALAEKKKNLATAFKTLENCECDVIGAVVVRPRSDHDESTLYLRVTGKDAQYARSLLGKASLIVLNPDEPTGRNFK